jgi:hypothetical protein
MVVVQAQERPVVVAVAFGTLASRHTHCHALAGTPPEEGIGAVAGAAEPDVVVAGDRQHVADPAASSSARNVGLAP